MSSSLKRKEEDVTREERIAYDNGFACGFVLARGIAKKKQVCPLPILEDLSYNIGDVIFYEGNIRRRDGKHLFRKPNNPQ